ncbi:period circadian protein homolog 3 isoform X2 [Rhineura floridana]|uniref:period circadian protein homolog 3 isoform X2 n=1 Tax=Rhineura floridana TaxID=261503 RepID=UPI002AC864E9|nr:period circadian protein homolog 3 isoform X2 [Rhineura floridana]
MNEDLTQDDLLDQQGNCLPATSADVENQQNDALGKQNGACEEVTHMFCGGSTESGSGGNESNGTSTHGLESNGSPPRNSNGQDRCRSGSCSSSSELLHWNQRSNEKLKMLIREIKLYLPAEKVEKYSKGSTLGALNYALKCVQQIQSDSRFFQAFGECGAYQSDAPAYSVGELAAVTSEHAPRNTDTFVAMFSLYSGRMVHISEQAAFILNCKKKCLDSSRFVELLAPEDVGTFYTHTNWCHLPLWNMEAKTESLYEYAQVKSFFCRLRRGKNQDQGKRYYPFRITPYLVNIYDSDPNEPTSCCLAVAEKIHSGYEAPRISLEKRIFTTAHNPGCLFLEVDDRAVPLLGYLPQDLLGTSILRYLHPDDRPLMVAIHRKVLEFVGHPPFQHSPVRFCTQNGDYVILDTSWSSFVNPWSRKVVFIIGRHKVRTSPLNEDVFAARSREINSIDQEIWQLQGQIYKLLLQPVHSNGSSGYGSLVSNRSYEHYISVASSSDSNGNGVEEIQRELQVFGDVNRLKNVGQQLYIESHSKPLTKKEQAPGVEGPGGKQPGAPRLTHVVGGGSPGDLPAVSCNDSRSTSYVLSYQHINCIDSIIRYLESCSIPALKRKCESSTNASSSSSDDDRQAQLSQNDKQILEDASSMYSITPQPPEISKLQVGAKQQQQQPATVVGAAMTDLALTAKALSVASMTSQCSYSSTLVHFPHPESEATAVEEATLQSEQVEFSPANTPGASGAVPEEVRLVGLTKEVLSAHTQKEEQNYVDWFRQKILLSPYRSYLQHGGAQSNQVPSQDQGDIHPKQTSPVIWERKPGLGQFKRQKPLASAASRSGACEQQATAVVAPSEGSHHGPSSVVLPAVDPYSVSGFPVAPLGGDHALLPSVIVQPCLPCSLQPIPAFPAPCMGGSFMAVLLQNFPVYPPLPFFPAQLPCSSTSYPCSVMPPGLPSTLSSSVALPDPVEHILLPSTPASAEEEQLASSGDQPQRLLSHSRSSSPLQLNLLQEELPKPLEPPGTAQAPPACPEAKCDEDGEEGSGNNDSHSVSSKLFDLLLLEDSQTGTDSAASGSGSAESSSLVSGSNGTSGCGTGSRNSSKYFASNDSSKVSKGGKKSQEEEAGEGLSQPTTLVRMAVDGLPEPGQMTYQIPKRIAKEVLKEDLEKLAAMESKQPRFTEGQKEELAEVHPWIRTQAVPQEIDTQEKESWTR